MIQTVTVEKEFSGNRVDKFLSEQFPDLSRSYIQKLIKDGHVTANGKIVKANYKLNALDTLALDKPELQEPDIVPENIPIDILYEDEDILIVNKQKELVDTPIGRTLFWHSCKCPDVHCKDSIIWNSME